MSAEDSHKTYINKKVAQALIHHHFADFGKTQYPNLITDNNLKFYRLGFGIVVLIALIL